MVPSASPRLRLPTDKDNVTALGKGVPFCKANLYGSPRLGSCIEAVATIPDVEGGFLSFGRRPKAKWVSLTVPFRFISCEKALL